MAVRSSWIAVIVCAACSSQPANPVPPVVATTPVADAAVADDQTPPPLDAMAADPGHEAFEITMDEPYTSRDGLVITLHSRGHKHAVGGGTTSRFALTVVSGDAEHEVSYSFSDSSAAWYIEGIAHGYVFTVESLFDVDDDREVLTEPDDVDKNQRRRVTLIPTDKVPLDDLAAAEVAWDIAQVAAADKGCSGSSRSSSQSDGSFQFWIEDGGAVICKMVVGVYSGRVIFVEP